MQSDSPMRKTGVGRMPKSGIESSHDTMIETAIAKPCGAA